MRLLACDMAGRNYNTFSLYNIFQRNQICYHFRKSPEKNELDFYAALHLTAQRL